MITQIQTDGFPEETTWIMDNGTDVVDRGGPYSIRKPAYLYRHDLRLTDGMYTLTVYDVLRDG